MESENFKNVNLVGYGREALIEFFSKLGEPSFRAVQTMKWIHQRGVTQFDAMTDLSKSLRAQLSQIATVEFPKVVNDIRSDDGTRKWLIELGDGNCVETVFIPEATRGTLCISSQVGCSLNCSFCATGRQGFNRNLETHEIISQVWIAKKLLQADGAERPITNIVLMGMGEPLLNYDNVIPALHLLLDDCSYGFSRRRVTLSTAGVVPGIEKLLEDCPVSLAVSLHAPSNSLRNELVPLNRKYPIEVLMASCRKYAAYDKRWRVTFEYIMLADVNDSLAHAKSLVKLLSSVPAKVNLIPYNEVEGLGYSRPGQKTLDEFREILLRAGIVAVTRKTRGDDVNAACGQLVGKFKDRTKRSSRLGVAAAPQELKKDEAICTV